MNVTVLGALIVKSLNVLDPWMITAPEPLPVIEILLYVFPPPANVLLVALVSEMTTVEVFGVTVRLVAVDTSQTVPVPDSVHVPEPIVMARVFALEELKLAQFMA